MATSQEIEARLDKALRKAAEARQAARSRGRHEAELVEDARALREAIEDKRRHRQKLSELEDQAQRERIADKVDVLEGELDRVVDRLDRVERRSEAAQRELDKHVGRVARLRERRRQIAEREGRLSQHFFRAEFNCREGGPCPLYMDPHLKQLADLFLEDLREEFGACSVNSGHRWAFYNAKIGGASQSFHVYEDRREDPAADVVFDQGTPAQWAARAREIANRVGLGGVGSYATFVHIDTGPRRDWSG